MLNYFKLAKQAKELRKQLEESDKKVAELHRDMYRRAHIIVLLGICKLGFTTRSEFLAHASEIIPDNIREILFGEDTKIADVENYRLNRLYDKVAYYLKSFPNLIKDDSIVLNSFKIVSDDHGMLLSTYKCEVCGSFMIVDDSTSNYDTPLVCNHCNKGYESPHRFLDIDSKAGQEYVKWYEHIHKIDIDKWYAFRVKAWYKVSNFHKFIIYKVMKKFKFIKAKVWAVNETEK